MQQKYLPTIGVAIALALIFIATTQYPGGSLHDANAVGFYWQYNYLSNLVGPVAVNGAPNTARPWAVAGVLVLCAVIAAVFVRISKKLPSEGGAPIAVKYGGAGAMAASVLLVTPYHDLGVTISGALLLLSLFYITVLLFMTKHHWLKLLATTCLLLLYGSTFIYSFRWHLELLPVLQKLDLFGCILLLLSIDRMVNKEDFKRPAKATGA